MIGSSINTNVVDGFLAGEYFPQDCYLHLEFFNVHPSTFQLLLGYFIQSHVLHIREQLRVNIGCAVFGHNVVHVYLAYFDDRFI